MNPSPEALDARVDTAEGHMSLEKTTAARPDPTSLRIPDAYRVQHCQNTGHTGTHASGGFHDRQYNHRVR